jgi:CheY-like chemotaxis protein/PAS domain-containing protein
MDRHMLQTQAWEESATGFALVTGDACVVSQCNPALTTMTGAKCGDALMGCLTQPALPSTGEKIPDSWDPLNVFFASQTQRWVRRRRLRGKGAKVDTEAQTLWELQDCTVEVHQDTQFRTFLNMTYDGYWDWNMITNYEYMSPRFWQMLGYDYRNMKPHPSEWQRIIFPEDAACSLVAIQRHVESHGALPFSEDVRYLHKDGHTVHVRCQGAVVEWDAATNTKPLRMVGTHTDNTQFLRQQITMSSYQIMEQIMHSMRNPLTAAAAAATTLETVIGDVAGLTETARTDADEVLTCLHTSHRRLAANLSSMQKLRDVIDGATAINCGTHDLYRDFLKPLQKELQAAFPAVLVVVRGVKALTATFDRAKLHQVFSALLERVFECRHLQGIIVHLSAAATASTEMTVTAELCCAEGQVTLTKTELLDAQGLRHTSNIDFTKVMLAVVHLSMMESTLSVLVPSKGAGTWTLTVATPVEVPASAAPVQAPVQAPASVAPAAALAVPAAAATKQGTAAETVFGSQTAETVFGSQTAETVFGSQTQRPAVPLPTVQSSKKAPGQLSDYYAHARVLFVDDEPIIRKLMTRRLQRLMPGATIECALSGREALQKVREQTFHLVFMDHFMPTGSKDALNGAQTTREMRRHGAAMPVIGFSASDVAKEHMAAGANQFIIKPAPPNPQLIRILNLVAPAV